MTSALRSASLAVLLLGTALSALPANAQERHRITRTPGELISALVREKQTPGGYDPASHDITVVLTHRSDYPAPYVEAILRGLEQLALTGDSPDLRRSVVLWLAIPGSRRSTHPVPGTVARLARLYRRDPAVRGVVVSAMADLAERQEALAFLERIAVQAPEDADFPESAGRALATLVAMGDEGRAVLKRLHDTRAVRDLQARYELSVLASRGYRI